MTTQGTDARSGETEGLDPKDDGPVRDSGCANSSSINQTPTTLAAGELLACPFCGGSAHINFFNNGLAGESWAFVECLRCEARSSMADDIGDTTAAIEAWNIRATLTPTMSREAIAEKEFARQRVSLIANGHAIGAVYGPEWTMGPGEQFRADLRSLISLTIGRDDGGRERANDDVIASMRGLFVRGAAIDDPSSQEVVWNEAIDAAIAVVRASTAAATPPTCLGVVEALERAATRTLEAMDRYNTENGTYIIGPALIGLGRAIADARAYTQRNVAEGAK